MKCFSPLSIGFLLLAALLPCGAAEYNAALGCHVAVPGALTPESAAVHLTDGRRDIGSRWISPRNSKEAVLTLTLEEPTMVSSVRLYPDWREETFRYRIGVPEFRLGDGAFHTPEGLSASEDGNFQLAEPIPATEVRVTLSDAVDGIFRVYEFEVRSQAADSEPEIEPLPTGGILDFSAIPAEGKIALAAGDWRFRSGDNPNWKRFDYDHGSWRKVEIGRPFTEQGFPANFGWYRLAFDLPEEWANRPAKLDLGPISFYDRTYVNGIPIGSTGSAPPEEALKGSSFMERGYPVPEGVLRAGRNVLAIRCYPGVHGGIYTRRAQLALDDAPLMEFAPGSGGIRLLTGTGYRNEYSASAPIELELEFIAVESGRHRLEIQLDGRKNTVEMLELTAGRVIRSPRLKLEMPEAGTHHVTLQLCRDGGGRKAAELQTEVTVLAPLLQRVTVNPDCGPGTGDDSAEWTVLKTGVGRFGGDRILEDGNIIDDFSIGNAEGNGVVNVLVRNDLRGPLLFLAGVAPSPKSPYPMEFYWKQPDNVRLIEGRAGVWGLGMVTIPSAPSSSAEQGGNRVRCTGADWSGKSYLFPDSGGMTLRMSVANPGLMFESAGKRIRLFDAIDRFGVEAPGWALLPGGGVLELSDGREHPLELTENWLLLSGAGTSGWENFDLPQLVTFSHRPSAIRRTADGIELSFPDGAGRFWLTPLVGCNVVPREEAFSWRGGLPVELQERCRNLSRLMLAYPVRVTETFRLRPDLDAVDFAIHPEFMITDDQWNTPPLPVAPLPGSLGIALETGFPVEVNAPIVDFNYATGNGPFFAIAREDGIPAAYRVKEALSPLFSVRHVVSPGKDETALAVFRDEYRRLLEHCPLERHPWNNLKNSPRESAPRTAFPLMNELIQCEPYLEDAERNALAGHFRDELRQIFLAPARWPRYRFSDGTVVRCSAEGAERLGIDESCWAGAHLYLLSEGFRVFGDGRDRITGHDLPLIDELHALLYATMDFSSCTAWDCFAGIRLGNGIQESNFFYLGHLAAARIDRLLGREAESQMAAAFAARQSLGVFAQFAGNRWARRSRNLCDFARERTEYYETRYAWRVAEHNEFCGMQLETFGNDGSLYTLLLAPVPETLEFYRRYAKDEVRYFLEHQLAGCGERASWAPGENVEPNHAINFADLHFYVLEEAFEQVRREFEAERGVRFPLFSDLSNARTVLDAGGTIQWRKIDAGNEVGK